MSTAPTEIEVSIKQKLSTAYWLYASICQKVHGLPCLETEESVADFRLSVLFAEVIRLKKIAEVPRSRLAPPRRI